jgi:Zn-dependent protease with chaperone function/tetratricopeptide (TPR) repeat protein
MLAVLLSLVVAQPAPDEARVVQNLFRHMTAATRIMATDPDGAVRLLDALLNDPEARELDSRSPTIHSYREQAFFFRAGIQLRQGQAQTVADDMTELLDRKRATLLSQIVGLTGVLASPSPDVSLGAAFRLPPAAALTRMDCYQALVLRAEAYKKLGQGDKEQADRAEATEILTEMSRSLAANPYPPEEDDEDQDGMNWSLLANLDWLPFIGHARWLISWVSGPLFIAAAFVVMVAVFFVTGMRQRREAGGSWRRLFCASLALAALQMAPVVAAFLLLRWRPWSYHASALPFVTPLVFFYILMRHCAYLAPVRFVQSGTALPLLEDAAVLDRVAQIASGLGVKPPVTRLVRSTSSLQRNHALITGLAAPTMVLFDGVLYRLTEEERDAIIAHELAHQANHTFWYWLAADALCSVAVVTASVFYPTLLVVCLGAVLLTGARRILSRWLELDCDRRAARAIGHRRAASALWKIHADQPFRGLIEFLIGAVSTHPSRDERLAAIYQDAANDDKPEVEWDSRVLRRRRLAAWGAGGLWLAVIVACLLWGYRWPGSYWPALPLALIEVALVVLLWLALAKTARRRRRLLRTRSAWLKRLVWLAPFLLIGFYVAESYRLTESYLSQEASLTILSCGSLAWLLLTLLSGRNRASRLNNQIVLAIQKGDYPKVIRLAEGSPAVVARDTKLRYNYALVRVVLGRGEEALPDLEKLRRDDPRFKMTWLLLIDLYTDEGEYARALELAGQLSRDLPGEPNGPLAESWLLRKLGRLDEAETRARDALRIEPRSGKGHLTLAAVAFDRDDLAGAHEQLAQAERLTPGSVAGALLAADIALAANAADAEAVVRRAVNAAKNNPLSFTHKAVASLVRRLEARSEAEMVVAGQTPQRPPE